jgi:tetratricopeptide (TPR) repeat protein
VTLVGAAAARGADGAAPNLASAGTPAPTWDDVFPHQAELVHCQNEPAETEDRTVRESVRSSLEAAEKLAKKKEFAAALAKIEPLAVRPEMSPFETFLIADEEFSLQLNLQNYAAAAQSMETTLASCFMPSDTIPGRMKNLAIVYYRAGDYPKAVQWASAYVAQTPDAEMQILVGQAYYLLENYPYAAAAVKLAMSTARSTGITVKESWLKLLLSSEYKLGNFAQIEAVLQELNDKFPNPTYAQQLSTLKATMAHQ